MFNKILDIFIDISDIIEAIWEGIFNILGNILRFMVYLASKLLIVLITLFIPTFILSIIFAKMDIYFDFGLIKIDTYIIAEMLWTFAVEIIGPFITLCFLSGFFRNKDEYIVIKKR